MRNYSILATEKQLIHPTRPQIKEYLLNPPDPPFIFCIATSGQKWLHIKSKVAYSQDNYPVQFEDLTIFVDRQVLKHILTVIEELYTVFSKEEIRTGYYPQHRIKSFGLKRFDELESRLTDYRRSSLFELAVFVAQKQEG